jgi:hypothetical protein
MRKWTRLSGAKLCGACGKVVPKGEPIQALMLVNLGRALYRCQACAEGPCPLDLPSPVVVQSEALEARMDAIGKVAAQFQKIAKKPVAVVPKKRAYRGGPEPVQPGMLQDLPVRTRG